jgi:phosphate transport system permease protein
VISRRAKETVFKALMIASLALMVLSLLAIILVIIFKGFPAMSLSMVLDTPKGGYYLGKEGGVANAIVGTMCLAFGASIIAILLSIPVALALQKEYSHPRSIKITRLILDVLWGTPSIVYGAFGFVIMVYFGIRASLLGGIIALSLVMMPIMIRSMEEVIRMIPHELKEIAYSLGTTRIETVMAVVLKQALPGIFTAVLLSFGRGAGDAASLLFTAGYTDYMPESLFDPVASLPLAVFFQIGTPIPEVQDRAYASALILLIIVLVVNIVSRLLGKRFSRNIIR